MGKPRRNDPCPCGSGKKYKYCHGTYSGSAINAKAEDGINASLKIEYAERVRTYLPETLIALPTKKPLKKVPRIPLRVGGASSIPHGYDEFGMFQRIYSCPHGLWHFNEDPFMLIFEDKRYQVELRRRELRIWGIHAEWRLDPYKNPVWDIDVVPKEQDPQGYYCCITVFVQSHDHSLIELEGINIADTLAGFISLTMTPDLVRNLIWEATCFFNGNDLEVRPNIKSNIFSVGPPSVVPDIIESVNALAASSLSEPKNTALLTALQYLSNEARSVLDQDRFIWLYLAVRIIVDSYYDHENTNQQKPEQEQRFKFYAMRHFPGESQIIEDFKKVYEKRNKLLKDNAPTAIISSDVVKVEWLCHRLIKSELEKRINQELIMRPLEFEKGD